MFGPGWHAAHRHSRPKRIGVGMIRLNVGSGRVRTSGQVRGVGQKLAVDSVRRRIKIPANGGGKKFGPRSLALAQGMRRLQPAIFMPGLGRPARLDGSPGPKSVTPQRPRRRTPAVKGTMKASSGTLLDVVNPLQAPAHHRAPSIAPFTGDQKCDPVEKIGGPNTPVWRNVGSHHSIADCGV